jgi:hypothetical protein
MTHKSSGEQRFYIANDKVNVNAHLISLILRVMELPTFNPFTCFTTGLLGNSEMIRIKVFTKKMKLGLDP